MTVSAHAPHDQSSGLPTGSPVSDSPPLAALCAALTAFTALALAEHEFTLVPIFGVAVLLSPFVRVRLSRAPLPNLAARLLLFGIVLLVTLTRAEHETSALVDSRIMGAFGGICAAEITLQAWSLHTAGGRRGVMLVFLGGMVLLSAANTMDYTVMPVCTPIYFLFLALAMPQFRPPGTRPERALPQWPRAIALAAALVMGAYLAHVLHLYRVEFTTWAGQRLHDIPAPEASGISDRPVLGAMFNPRPSTRRLLQIEGTGSFSHLRAIAFPTYRSARWWPGREHRTMGAAPLGRMLRRATGSNVRITRLVDNKGLLFTPLNTVSFDSGTDTDLEWAPDEGGPLTTKLPAPTTYQATVGSDDAQGPFCSPGPLTPEQRASLLEVPPDIDPAVRDIAFQAAAGSTGPRAQAEAITTYLATHYQYSLTFHPGRGDPVSIFLMQHKSAHCELFASACTLMLRYVGVPARYTIGYYAHETVGPGQTVVRQRDAHAWTEAWIDGVGWITLDATPGGGRPDELARPLPLWQRLQEQLEDSYAWLRHALTSTMALRVGGGIFLLFVAWVLWTNRPARRARGERERVFRYTPPPPSLAELAARFDTWAKGEGFGCRPEQTWVEALSVLAAGEHDEGRSAALEYMKSYDAVRFGASEEATLAEECADLSARLAEIERRYSTSRSEDK